MGIDRGCVEMLRRSKVTPCDGMEWICRVTEKYGLLSMGIVPSGSAKARCGADVQWCCDAKEKTRLAMVLSRHPLTSNRTELICCG